MDSAAPTPAGHEEGGTSLMAAVSWAYAARYSAKSVTFVSTVILARLLLPQDFGLAGFALIVIGYLEVLRDLGIGAAVVYLGDDEEDRDTAFWLNLLAGLLLAAVAWLIAPWAGEFFDDERAVDMTRVLGLMFPVIALGNIHRSIMERRLDFKRLFIPEVAMSVGKGSVAITLALAGVGAWSLVIGQVGGTALAAVASWFVLRWRPSLRFVKDRAGPLIRYGSHIVAVNALGVLLNNMDYLFVGRFLGVEALGVYTLAFRLPELLVKELSSGASKALFPAFSGLRQDPAALKRRFLETMSYLAVVIVPIGLGLAAVSDPLIRTLYTDKWEDAIPVLSVIAVYMVLQAVAFNIGDIYKATGRPGLLSKVSLARLPVLIVGLWWATTGPETILAVAVAQLISAVFTVVLSIAVASRTLDIRAGEILGSFWSAFIAGGLMTGAVAIVLLLLPSGVASPLELVLGVGVGAVVYGAAVWVLEREKLVTFLRVVRNKLSGNTRPAPLENRR
jgi:PST family polysaccharide transporter